MKGCAVGLRGQILVGLQRVGLLGLREALQQARESGLSDREEVVDFLVQALSVSNYIPEPRNADLRTALWREFKRSKGEDIRDLYTDVAVEVRGDPGNETDAFVETLISVFADYELRPLIAYAPKDAQGPNPQLLLHGEPVAKGRLPRRSLKLVVQKHLTHW